MRETSRTTGAAAPSRPVGLRAVRARPRPRPSAADSPWTLPLETSRVTVVLAMVFAVFDGLATYLHLSFGTAVEGNLVVASMIDLWGPHTGLLIRTGEVLALIAVLGWLTGRSRTAQRGLMTVTVILGSVAVYHLAGPTFAGV